MCARESAESSQGMDKIKIELGCSSCIAGGWHRGKKQHAAACHQHGVRQHQCPCARFHFAAPPSAMLFNPPHMLLLAGASLTEPYVLQVAPAPQVQRASFFGLFGGQPQPIMQPDASHVSVSPRTTMMGCSTAQCTSRYHVDPRYTCNRQQKQAWLGMSG